MKSKHATSRLLAGRNRLGRLEKEQILDEVLAQVAPRKHARWWLAVLPAVAAAALLLLFLLPRQASEPGEFATRGAGHALGVLRATCGDGCNAGDKLVFDLYGSTGYRYFAAFAQRADGTVLWYFPASDEAVSTDLTQQQGGGVLDRSIVVGPEHSPGTYRLFGVFSNEPLTRQQIRERFDEATLTAGRDTRVVVQELVVQ